MAFFNGGVSIGGAGIDTDGDGLTDAEEAILGTDPNNPDTDSDEFSDYDEFIAGSDPLNPDSIPPTPPPGGVWVESDGLDPTKTYRLKISLVDINGVFNSFAYSLHHTGPLSFIAETTPPAGGYYGAYITYSYQHGSPSVIENYGTGAWSGSVLNFLRIGTVVVEELT